MTAPSRRYDWDEPYRLAVLETDPTQLMPRVIAAKSAIKARVAELSNDGLGHQDELKTIESALRILELLAHEAREEQDFSE